MNEEDFYFEGNLENDPDIENAEEIQQLTSEISYIQSMLRVPQSIRGAIIMSAFGYIAGKNMAGNDPTAKMILAGLGGLAGLKLGAKKELTEEEKQRYQDLLAQKVKELNALQNKLHVEKETVLSATEIRNYQYEHYPFNSPWSDFMGLPSKNFHAMVFGKPKSGKSILCVKLADYLSQFGSVLYIAAEEGFSATLKQKMEDFSIEGSGIFFANFRKYEQIKEGVKGYDFVIIDSINYAQITVEQVEELKQLNPDMALIAVQQATKDGKFRGSQEYAHNCDIIIEVDNGTASQRGRFQAHSEMVIFEPAQGPDSKPADKPKKKRPVGRPKLSDEERERRHQEREKARRNGKPVGRPRKYEPVSEDRESESQDLFSFQEED